MAIKLPADLVTDALRENLKLLDGVIAKIRTIHGDGKTAPKSAVRYLEYIHAAHELRERGEDLGLNGPLFRIVEPIPFHTQLVGRSAEQVRTLEWKAPRVPYPPVQHHQQFIAARAA